MLVSFLLGALVVLTIRFITYKPESAHYHANFAVYINGQREDFKQAFYYEAVAACTLDKHIQPPERVHMHDQINDVVHVHDHGVAWGHFFQNLGWYIGPDQIKIFSQPFFPDAQNKITFILNGEKVPTVTNLIIGDQDKLLVDFGSTTEETLQKEYHSIAATAQKYNQAADPKSCSGQKEATFRDRLEHLL